MAAKKPYERVYAPDVAKHVSKIEKKYHSLIRDEIERQLRVEPEKETRNRKPLLRPPDLGSAWELRFGPDNRFRVFYRTDRERRQVYILAIGIKIRNRLRVGGEEFDL